MTPEPTVSVIIPTYNRAHLLGKAIQSVLSQTYRYFELIVVDDCSTDNTEEVVKSVGDERIRYVRHEKNSGGCAAPRNTGIKIARGEYIASQDDDTEWLPQKLEKQVQAFEKAPPRVGAVYTGMWTITDNEKAYRPSPSITQKEGDIHAELLKHNYIGHPAILVKKECFTKVGMYDETLPAIEDWDMWLRISRYYDFQLVDEPLVTTYFSSATGYFGQSAVAKAAIMLFNRHSQEFKEDDRNLLAERYFNAGAALCINEDLTQFAEGRKAIQKAAKICPLNLKYDLVSLASLPGPALFHNRSFRNIYRRFSKSVLQIG